MVDCADPRVRDALFAQADVNLEARVLADLGVLGDGDVGRGLDAELHAERRDLHAAASVAGGIPLNRAGMGPELKARGLRERALGREMAERFLDEVEDIDMLRFLAMLVMDEESADFFALAHELGAGDVGRGVRAVWAMRRLALRDAKVVRR